MEPNPMQPNPYCFPEWDLARPIPKRRLDFVLEETAWLAVKASRESKDVCVDSWGLEPETDWDREVGRGRVSLESSAGACYVKDKGGGTYNLKIMNFNSLFTPASRFECL